MSWIVTEQVAWDSDGNVTEAVEHSFVEGQAGPSCHPAHLHGIRVDPAGRFRQRLSRVRQTGGDGTLLAETRTEYDHLPLGLNSARKGW